MGISIGITLMDFALFNVQVSDWLFVGIYMSLTVFHVLGILTGVISLIGVRRNRWAGFVVRALVGIPINAYMGVSTYFFADLVSRPY